MQIGVDSFGAVIAEPATGVTLSPVERMDNLLEEIVLAGTCKPNVLGARGYGIYQGVFRGEYRKTLSPALRILLWGTEVFIRQDPATGDVIFVAAA